MKNTALTLAGMAAALHIALLPQPAWALASDREQPMHIEADALRHDDAKQVTVFNGNVVVKKGSIVLRGETLTVTKAADGSQHGTIQGGEGQRAFFSQQRDTPPGAPAETVQGQARTIEYNGATDEVRLRGQGELRRYRASALNDEITGSVIVYNNRSGHFSVDGQPRQSGQGQSGQGDRVRAIIGAGTTGKGEAAPASLQPSPALESRPQ